MCICCKCSQKRLGIPTTNHQCQVYIEFLTAGAPQQIQRSGPTKMLIFAQIHVEQLLQAVDVYPMNTSPSVEDAENIQCPNICASVRHSDATCRRQHITQFFSLWIVWWKMWWIINYLWRFRCWFYRWLEVFGTMSWMMWDGFKFYRNIESPEVLP